MKAWQVFALITCLAATAVVGWRSKGLAVARETTNAVEPGGTESVASNIIDSAETIQLREQTKDLPRLRNEITQLRARKGELDAARLDRAQLVETAQAGTRVSRETPPGFVSKDRLGNAGFGTPESALQTFFWAMREGDSTMAIGALATENDKRENLARLSVQKRADLMNSFSDFGVRGREVLSDNSVALQIGSSIATNTIRIEIVREGGEWRLLDFPP
jgi:hypothetical protein